MVDVKKSLRICNAEIFKVQETMRIVLAHKLYKFVDERIILIASDTSIRPPLSLE